MSAVSWLKKILKFYQIQGMSKIFWIPLTGPPSVDYPLRGILVSFHSQGGKLACQIFFSVVLLKLHDKRFIDTPICFTYHFSQFKVRDKKKLFSFKMCRGQRCGGGGVRGVEKKGDRSSKTNWIVKTFISTKVQNSLFKALFLFKSARNAKVDQKV